MLKNRTLIGIILIVAAIGLCFGISPLFNTILASKTTIIRLKQDIPQGVQITGSMPEKDNRQVFRYCYVRRRQLQR